MWVVPAKQPMGLDLDALPSLPGHGKITSGSSNDIWFLFSCRVKMILIDNLVYQVQ